MNTRAMLFAAFSSLILSTGAIADVVPADDANWIRADQLPKTVSRSFYRMGRGEKVPASITREVAMAEALRDNRTPERQCMAKVGDQYTPWKTVITEDGFYWTYSLSAKFGCLAPRTSTEVARKGALSDALADTSSARVLCYEKLDQICVNGRLHGYNEHYTCEITSADGTRVIEDIEDRVNQGWSKNEGARALKASLPVYVDSRRDDEPSGNCNPHKWNRLKGLSRKGATLRANGEQIVVEGMIDAE